VLVDDERASCVTAAGIDAAQIDASSALWSLAITEHGAVSCVDARRNPRFADDPMVAGPAGLRAFMALPLITVGGHAIGALCVADRVARSFDEPAHAALAAAALAVTRQFDVLRNEGELRRVRREVALLRDRLMTNWARAQRLLGSADAGLVLVDDEMRIIDASPVAVRILALDLVLDVEHDVGGRVFAEQIRPQDRLRLTRWFHGVDGAAPRQQPVVVRATTPDERELTISCHEDPAIDGASGAVLVVAPTNDG